MPLLGPFSVEFGTVFPAGAYAVGAFEKVRDFDKSKGDVVVQQVDKLTGLPLWVIEVVDPQEGTRKLTVKVKVTAQVQPVLPPPVAGSPFTPVEFEGLNVMPYVDSDRCKGDGKGKCGARQAYSLKATGVRAPSRGMGRPLPEHKDAA
jgi:hypothetical protein